MSCPKPSRAPLLSDLDATGPQQIQKGRLVEDLELQLLGLRQLRPGIRSSDDIVGLRGDRRGHLGPQRLQVLLGFAARETFQAPGQNKSEPF